MGLPIGRAIPRGTLQPEQPVAVDAIKCEVCGGWWLAGDCALHFGCPYCAHNRELQEIEHEKTPDHR